ncbi:Inner membrane protein YgaP [Pirellulimonas nuda]|uniref:Inner membrane protein YgaP n=1 Tax=Pirellulimonas nuda TaxID=2528009 RepID=A0A518DJA9_9BACT|nr:rhodanese-like domain-containing protein [Pirellulimonas nuda]QDU91571.1 Inner membrane protein YgaP [Pirellulimonas nuda]
MTTQSLSPGELRERLAGPARPRLIDVRTPAEFREVHVDGAVNRPLDRLDPKGLLAEFGPDQELVFICKAGSRGATACGKLAAAGAGRVLNVEGGTEACAAAGLPVTRGKQCMSLERQVRIAAGTLVVLGVVLGVLVHPWLLGLSALVGAGLVLAGVTNTCGMGMLLAKMPWNQAGSCSA